MACHLGPLIKKHRARRGFDQHAVARALGVSQAQVSKIEAGAVVASYDQMLTLARLFSAPELLLEAIQPCIDAALDLADAAPADPERDILDLIKAAVADMAAALAEADMRTADAATARLITLAQVARVLITQRL